MSKKMILNGNEAVVEGAILSRVQVIGAYPITPTTTVPELLSKACAEGRLNAEFVPVESEDSAISVIMAASYIGARGFTASCSHGLAFMHQGLHAAGCMRLPIGLFVANRAMGQPWNIWTDQNDSLSQRDTGWIQLYCENSQEVLDTAIMLYRLAENPEVMLPVMLVGEGFILSHTGEVVEVPEQELVDRFLPPYNSPYKLDVKNPRAFGALTVSEEYFKMRIDAQEAMERVKKVAKQVDREFGKLFGRSYGIIEKFHWPKRGNPKIVLVTSGTVTSTARHILLNEKGLEDVGLLKIKLFRPFPTEDVRRALKGVEKVAVIDRNISPGKGGIFASELESVLCNLEKRPKVFSFITGLGGFDITPEIIKEAVDFTREQEKPEKEIIWLPLGIEKAERPQEAQETEERTEKLLCSGHSACQGCGLILGHGHTLEALGSKTIGVYPAGCTTSLIGVFPQRALGITFYHVNFETGASSASGIRAALKILGLENEIENVLAGAGDGATYDIGLAGLSGAAERGDNIIYLCVNNEAYMNTGIQRSSATPFGAWTTTTKSKKQVRKPLPEIMAAHRIPYVATASIAFLDDLERKVKKAKEINGGLRYIELLVPCPTGWRFPSEKTIEVARLAVLTGAFPLYEVENGEKWTITVEPEEFLPIEEYLKLQGRFSHLKPEDIAKIQEYVEKEWRRLKKFEKFFKD